MQVRCLSGRIKRSCLGKRKGALYDSPGQFSEWPSWRGTSYSASEPRSTSPSASSCHCKLPSAALIIFPHNPNFRSSPLSCQGDHFKVSSFSQKLCFFLGFDICIELLTCVLQQKAAAAEFNHIVSVNMHAISLRCSLNQIRLLCHACLYFGFLAERLLHQLFSGSGHKRKTFPAEETRLCLTLFFFRSFCSDLVYISRICSCNMQIHSTGVFYCVVSTLFL